jgi:hypothetical protein
MRPAVISFAIGAAASILAGMFTSGLAAAYALVAMGVWGFVEKVGGSVLANATWLIVLLTSAVHGLIFMGIIMLGRLLFPRLKQSETGVNLFVIAAVLYAILLSLIFPVQV